jgi:hypothetical protein
MLRSALHLQAVETKASSMSETMDRRRCQPEEKSIACYVYCTRVGQGTAGLRSWIVGLRLCTTSPTLLLHVCSSAVQPGPSFSPLIAAFRRDAAHAHTSDRISRPAHIFGSIFLSGLDRFFRLSSFFDVFKKIKSLKFDHSLKLKQFFKSEHILKFEHF